MKLSTHAVTQTEVLLCTKQWKNGSVCHVFFGSLLSRLETWYIHTQQKDLVSYVNCLNWISGLQTGDKITRPCWWRRWPFSFSFKSFFFFRRTNVKNIFKDFVSGAGFTITFKSAHTLDIYYIKKLLYFWGIDRDKKSDPLLSDKFVHYWVL